MIIVRTTRVLISGLHLRASTTAVSTTAIVSIGGIGITNTVIIVETRERGRETAASGDMTGAAGMTGAMATNVAMQVSADVQPSMTVIIATKTTILPAVRGVRRSSRRKPECHTSTDPKRMRTLSSTT